MRSRVLWILVALGCAMPSADARGGMLSFSNWVFWYHANREAYEPPRLLRADVDAMAPPTILPALKRLRSVDVAGHPATQSSAYLALGKVARTGADVEAILDGLSDATRSLQAVEPATLALGLLRRSDPGRRLDGNTLDRARDALWGVLRDPRQQQRVRGFAAVSLGLLADQPSAREGPSTAARLFELLGGEPGERLDVHAGMLLATGLLDPATVTAEHRQELVSGVEKGTLRGREVPRVLQGMAAQALGRVGGAGEAPRLLRVMISRRSQPNVQRSCAAALGNLGVRLGGAARAGILDGLAEALRKRRVVRDETTRGFAIVSLARILAAEVAEGSAAGLAKAPAFEGLLAILEEGRVHDRAYAALGLGLVLRALPADANDDPKGPRARAARALEKELDSKKTRPRGRGAAAVALGLARHEGITERLGTLVADRRADATLRGYAAEGLGFLGSVPVAVQERIANASRESQTEEMRVLTLHALSLVGSEDAVARGLHELRTARGGSLKGEAALLLGRTGDADVARQLLAIASDEKEQDLTRSIAVAALGRLADPEPVPSLARVTTHLNHRLSTDLVNALYGVY